MERIDDHLKPYTTEQMEQGGVLPEKISSISHDVEVAEESRIERVISQIQLTNAEVSRQTNVRFCFLGSTAMYAYLHEMSGDATKLQILEARIAGGKNDIDLAVPKGEMKSLMEDFGWGEEEKGLGRGYVDESRQIVDVMDRQELPSFGWQEVVVGGEKILLQHPVEMIFEKMITLQTAEEKEVKWGVDIKILKAYLVSKNGLNEVEVEKYLAEQFEVYKKEINQELSKENRAILNGVQAELQSGKSKEAALGNLLEKRLGQPVENLQATLVELFGDNLDYDRLFSQGNDGFINALNILMDERSGIKYSYQDLAESSQEKYSNLLANL